MKKVLLFFAIMMMAITASAKVYEVSFEKSENINIREGQSKVINGVKITCLAGNINPTASWDTKLGHMWRGECTENDFQISTENGETITSIEITTEEESRWSMYYGVFGTGWTTITKGAAWTGSATSVNVGGEFEQVIKLTVTVDETTAHTHNYATTWSTDANNHWHACTGEGECNAPKSGEAAHSYGEVATETAYYTCSVCQYENATRKAEYEAAVKAAADQAAADAVVTKINAIGTVAYTEASKALIDAARAAYDALTEDQKALITAEQLKVLEDAEVRYTKLKTDALAAAAVVEKIEAIGTVEYTPECKAKIDAARAAYDALTEDQKALITAEQLKTLEDAEAEYHVLMLKAMAQPVIDLIDAIAPVDDSYNTAKAISDARIAYDNLIAEAKPYVTNYDDLVAAEVLYNQMVSFDSYRNSRSLLLGARLTQFDDAKVRREVADAAQRIQALEYIEELTYAENKKRVDDIYNTYLDILKKSRHDAVVADLLEVAKHNGKASIMLFVAASDSQRAIDAANEGIAKIDALEYDYEADLSANVDDVFDIVLDTKINIVKAWQADFEDFKAEIIKKIQEMLGIGSMTEAKVSGMFYDYSLTREENNAKLNDVMESLGGTTGINAIDAATAKNGKYIENGKIVIVKNGKAYTAAGQMK